MVEAGVYEHRRSVDLAERGSTRACGVRVVPHLATRTGRGGRSLSHLMASRCADPSPLAGRDATVASRGLMLFQGSRRLWIGSRRAYWFIPPYRRSGRSIPCRYSCPPVAPGRNPHRRRRPQTRHAPEDAPSRIGRPNGAEADLSPSDRRASHPRLSLPMSRPGRGGLACRFVRPGSEVTDLPACLGGSELPSHLEPASLLPEQPRCQARSR